MRKIFVPLFDDLMEAIEQQHSGPEARSIGELVPFCLEYDCFRLERDGAELAMASAATPHC